MRGPRVTIFPSCGCDCGCYHFKLKDGFPGSRRSLYYCELTGVESNGHGFDTIDHCPLLIEAIEKACEKKIRERKAWNMKKALK